MLTVVLILGAFVGGYFVGRNNPDLAKKIANSLNDRIQKQ